MKFGSGLVSIKVKKLVEDTDILAKLVESGGKDLNKLLGKIDEAFGRKMTHQEHIYVIQKVMRQQRKERVLPLRESGMSLREIGAQLDISGQAVHKLLSH